MKISQQTISIIGVLSILALVMVQGPMTNWKNHDFYEHIFTPQKTKFTRINGEIDLTKKRLDSLNFKKNDDANDGYSYYGWSFDNIGVGKFKRKGTYPDTTYLQFGYIGVDINEDMGKSFLSYYEKNGQGYLSRTKFVGNYTEMLEVRDDNGKLLSRVGNKVFFIDKKVDYRYSYAQKSMMVPLTTNLAKIIAIGIIWIMAFFQFAALIIIIGLFFRFLVFIARNSAFEEGNIQRLKYMSIAFFFLAVNKFILSWIAYLIFISFYSSDGVVINYSFWEKDYLMMIFAILCYLIYTAFKRGMILQDESELTI